MASASNDSSSAQVPPAVKASQGLPGQLPSRAHQALCRPVWAPTLCPPCPSAVAPALSSPHLPSADLPGPRALPSRPLCHCTRPLFSPRPLQTQSPLPGSQEQSGQGLRTLCLVLCYLSRFTLSQFPQDGTQMPPYLSSRLSLIPNLNHHRHHHQDISHKNRGLQLL